MGIIIFACFLATSILYGTDIGIKRLVICWSIFFLGAFLGELIPVLEWVSLLAQLYLIFWGIWKSRKTSSLEVK